MPKGQRRYVESLSAYARQFLEMMQKPDVEHIDGLSPGHQHRAEDHQPQPALHRRHRHRNLRLHAPAVGAGRRALQPATGLPIRRRPSARWSTGSWRCPKARALYLLAPVVRGRKGEYRKELAEWQKAGFTRVRIDGEIYAIEEAPALDKKYKHDIEVVVDRLAVKEGIETRLADSFEQALKLAEGLAYVDLADGVVPGREGEAAGRQ
jgi:excinuclease ABC subunit A